MGKFLHLFTSVAVSRFNAPMRQIYNSPLKFQKVIQSGRQRFASPEFAIWRDFQTRFICQALHGRLPGDPNEISRSNLKSPKSSELFFIFRKQFVSAQSWCLITEMIWIKPSFDILVAEIGSLRAGEKFPSLYREGGAFRNISLRFEAILTAQCGQFAIQAEVLMSWINYRNIILWCHQAKSKKC